MDGISVLVGRQAAIVAVGEGGDRVVRVHASMEEKLQKSRGVAVAQPLHASSNTFWVCVCQAGS